MKRKIISFILVSIMCFCSLTFPTFAQEIVLEEKITGTINSVTLSINIEKAQNFIPGEMIVNLYSEDKELIDSQSIWVYNDEISYKAIFNFNNIASQDSVYVSISSPVSKITASGTVYNTNDLIPFNTFVYHGNNEKTQSGDFSLSVLPVSSNPVSILLDDVAVEFKNQPKIINNNCMVSLYDYLNAATLIECALYDEESGKITITVNENTLVFTLNSKDVLLNGSSVQSPEETILINNTVYLPLRFLVENLGGTVDASKNEAGNLVVKTAIILENEAEAFVNEKGITSKSDYLIWVSKSDYKVTVFKNTNSRWKYDREFDCAIGAKNTPTITGEYYYYSKEKQWSYPGYYVAPIMRFYKGYALHSTLIKYNGTPYDDTVGEMVSHGCVRLHPEDINWLADNIPLYTKIYITD